MKPRRSVGAAAIIGGAALLSLVGMAWVLFSRGESTISLLILAAAIVIGAAVLGTAQVIREAVRLPVTLLDAGAEALRGMFDWLGGILKPRIEVRAAVLSGIQRFDHHGKLVVGSLRVDVHAQIVETTALGTLFGQAAARGVGVQYFIPLRDLTVENFRWNFTVDQASGERGIAVYCSLPAPQVDDEFIAIDESCIETLTLGTGVQSINPWSGKSELTARARAELKPRALEAARRPECLLAAERIARAHVEGIVRSITASLVQLSAGHQPPIAVLVEFESSRGSKALAEAVNETGTPADH